MLRFRIVSPFRHSFIIGSAETIDLSGRPQRSCDRYFAYEDRTRGFPIESRPLHDAFWRRARAKDFAFRRLYDTRSALTMTAQGVTEFATVNVKDFEGLGFRKVWNPLARQG